MTATPLILLGAGAGASAEAGVPMSHQMTEKLVREIGRDAHARYRGISPAMNFICGSLIAYDAAAGADPYAGLDVERVFAAVQLLATRRDLEISPFVGSWHPAVEAWDTPPRRAIDAYRLDRQVQRTFLAGRPGGPSLSDGVIGLIKDMTSPGTGATYAELARQLLTELRRLLALTSKDVGYLRPLADMASRDGGLTVATLNYDRSVELAAPQEVDTGIASWLDGGSRNWRDRGLRLLKLHGSIDWSWEQRERESGRLPERVVEVSDDAAGDRRPPAIVFGQRDKLRAEGPFLSLLAEFEAQLAQSGKLVAIGYSFRDEHINEVIRRWLNGAPERTVRIVDPFLPERPERDDFRGLLLRHLADGDTTRADVWRLSASAALARLRDESAG